MSTVSPFIATLTVAAGGAVGSVARYQVGRMMTMWLGPVPMGARAWGSRGAWGAWGA